MARASKVSWILLGVMGCAHAATGLVLDSTARDKASRTYVGRDFVLASSLYTSDFFGDSTRLYVDARPFDIVELWRHDGEGVVVAAPRAEIVPAGTPVRVKELAFPVDPLTAPFDARTKQPLAPTAHTWVQLERSDKASPPLVLVLPRDIAGAAEFAAEMQKRLASPQWMTSWLAQANPRHLALIFEKRVEKGMSRAEVAAALGEPRNAGAAKESGALEFVADYGDLQITLQGNVVTDVLSRKAEAALARERAAKNIEAARLAQQQQQALAEKDRQALAAAEAKRQAEAAELRAREAAEVEKARQQDEVARAAEAKKQLAREADDKRAAELKARIEQAQRDKENAEIERQRRVEEARLRAEVTKAEAEARIAQKRAEADAKKAEAEAEMLRRKLAAEMAKSDVATTKAPVPAENSAPVFAAKPAGPKLPSAPRKIGVTLQPLTKDKAFDLGRTSLAGCLVSAVARASAAELAGLVVGDLLLTVDGAEVSSPDAFTQIVGGAPATNALVLSVWRGGKTVAVTVPAQSTASLVSPQAAPTPVANAQPPAPAPNRRLLPERRSQETSSEAAP